MAYQIVAIRLPLSDFHGHSPTASLSKCHFSYICVAVDKIATDIEHHAVSVRSLSFSLLFVALYASDLPLHGEFSTCVNTTRNVKCCKTS